MRIAWLCLAAAALVVIPAGLGGVRHAAVEPLPLSTCSPIVYGGSGSPSLLIASDLPIAAFQFRSTTLRMQKAIEYVLARHRYRRSEEHTSELQSQLTISYAVFCLRSEERRVGKECS